MIRPMTRGYTKVLAEQAINNKMNRPITRECTKVLDEQAINNKINRPITREYTKVLGEQTDINPIKSMKFTMDEHLKYKDCSNEFMIYVGDCLRIGRSRKNDICYLYVPEMSRFAGTFVGKMVDNNMVVEFTGNPTNGVVVTNLVTNEKQIIHPNSTEPKTITITQNNSIAFATVDELNTPKFTTSV